MKRCPACTHEIADQVAVCPFCRHRFLVDPTPTPGAPAPPDPHGTTQVSMPAIQIPGAHRRQRQLIVMGEASQLPGSTTWGPWPWLIPLLAVVGVIAWLALRVPRFPEGLAQARVEGAAWPCDGAERCVVVFLAPWDEASRQSLPTLQAVREQAGEGVAVAVVVGAGERTLVQQMADEIGPDAFIDPEGRTLEKLKARIVPMWFVLDAKGDVTTSVEGTYKPVEDHLRRLGI